MSDTRIYRVDEQIDGDVTESFLVRASSPAQAVRHIAQRFEANVATQSDLVELLGKVKVQSAGGES